MTGKGAATAIAIGVLGLGLPIMIFAAIGVAGQRNAAEAMQVEIAECRFDGTTAQLATVKLRVTNRGDEARGATVSLVFRDASGARVDTDTAIVKTIPAGDTAVHEELTSLDSPAGPGGSCEVADVQ